MRPVKAVQELSKENDVLKKDNAELKSRLDKFEIALSECCVSYKTGVGSPATGDGDLARLEQNNPNPFTQNTTIEFYVPHQTIKAILKIYSLDGFELKSFVSEKTGINEITVSAGTLSAGVYVYTLMVDGKAVDSKQMILTK